MSHHAAERRAHQHERSLRRQLEQRLGVGARDGADPREPKRKKAKLPITGVRVLPDRRTVSIDIRDFGPATNISFRYRLKDAEGEMMRGELHGTVNRVPGKNR